MKVAVFGSEGQLGVELVRVFNERGHQVRGFSRRSVDICDAAQVESTVAAMEADLVLNAAAYNKVDVAETEPQVAYAVNGLAVRNLAVACRQSDARLVHFSTDYVFDGMAGRPYREDDLVRPLSAYGVSKLAGELYAQAYCDSALVLRTSGVFGPAGVRTAGGNFIESMLRLAAKGQPLRVVQDHVASPTYAPELARVTADLVESKQTGVFHTGGGEAISWYDYAAKIFAKAGVSPELKPTTEREYRTPARRPKYSALENTRLAALPIKAFPSLDEQIALYFQNR
ncbi:dTDP-4-dehydrorhamnose reductase [Bryobacter aggregatus]|uniref:dTDP-4-dehydrorhamnose reductase n=1 Tax=Bryobacter aggregatus TaxID=360054 RepID=UPI000560C94F|nr:dTDP-4-dehydrorhamnose reductase [Bryobacter aggregatus]